MNVPSRTGVTAGVATGPRHSARVRRTPTRVNRALMAGGLAAVTAAGAVTFSGMAQAGNPPTGPGNIEIFAKRDMVALEGYSAQAGETATVTVSRGGKQIGIGQGEIDETGFLEFNHPGGECWVGVTPNISSGDEVSVSFSEAPFTDAATVGSAMITSVTASPVVATPEAGDVEGTVTIKGTYGSDVAESRFVVEVVNPTMREVGVIGERAIGWTPGNDPAHPNGGPGHTATGTFANGQFEAVFGLQSAADQKLVKDGDHVVLSWMADGAGDLALGATQYEFEEIDGPGFGGCPAGAVAQPGVAPSTATLASATDSTSIDVGWTAPAQPADSSAVSAYRVSAIGGDFSGQEVAVRTSGTTATLQGLKAGAPYEVKIEAYNGQWSPANSVGTVTVGSGAGGTTPPGGSTDPGTGTPPATAPDAPTGVTASATASGGADVSWTASTGAASYAVSTSSTVAGAATPQPVTVQAPATTASLTGLTPGTAYTVSVKATNVVGSSTVAGTATVTTNPAAAPGAFNLTRVLTGHQSITTEWTAAAAGNAASTVTGYDLVATPADGQAAVTSSVTALTGTLTGLRNGIEYTVTVVAKSGSATTTATKPASVNNKVKPNDVATVGRAEFRADRNEYRITGTVQDTTLNTVTVRLSTGAGLGTLVQTNVPVGADGSWTVNLRNGPALPAGATLKVASTSGANLTGVAVTRR